MINSHGLSKRGSLLVVVMGLIVLMLGLTMGLASRVMRGIDDSATTQRQAQAFIMTSNAKIVLLGCYDKFKAGDTTNAIEPLRGTSIGDFEGTTTTSTLIRPYLGRLGWARIKSSLPSSASPSSAAITAGLAASPPVASCDLLTAGGAGGWNKPAGTGGAKATSLGGGTPEVNAFDIRYAYTVSATFGATLADPSYFRVIVQPIKEDSSYAFLWTQVP